MIKRDIILLVASILFFISLFLDRLINNSYSGGLLLIVVAALAYNSSREKITLFKKRPHLWFMLAFACMLLISFFLSENRQTGIQFLQRRLPLLLFPLSIGLLKISRELRDKILLSLGIIVCTGCLFSLGWALYQYHQLHDSAWLYNDALSWFIGQQSIYTSVLVNVSIYIFAYHIFFTAAPQSKKILLGLGILFLLIISYLLASRNMMLILYLTIIGFSIFIILKRKKYLEGATLLIGLVLAGFMIFKFFPKTINRFKELAFTQFNYESRAKESHYNMTFTADQWNGANFRLAAWPCGMQLFKQHPLLGVGLGDKKDELFKVYEEKQFHFALETKKNIHNNYLDILYSMGIVGFILFFAGWILLPLVNAFRMADWLGLLIILVISLAMITEVYFDRGLGIMLAGFFIPFLSATKKNNRGLEVV